MERSKNYFLVLMSCFVFLFLFQINFLKAQSAYKKAIYNAYVSGDMKKWADVIHTIEQNGDLKTAEKKLELVSYYYGYIGYLIGIKNFKEAKLIITKAEIQNSQVLKASPKNATAYAFQGSFTGFKIAINKYKALSLGPESAVSINKGFEIDPLNVQILVDKANALYYRPKLFGGNKIEALKLYRESVTLMEKTKNTTNNWFYLNVLTLTAQAYESLNKKEQALQIYEKTLRLEPNYKWVKLELLPALKNKM